MIDLATWNLSIPVGIPATTINTPVLVGGYQDYYFKSLDGRVLFWTPVNGTTTANASYPRSELRETLASGALRNWTYPGAQHTLSAQLSISQVPSTGKIVIGQIHAHGSSRPMLKLEYQYKTKTATANLVAKIRNSPDDAEGAVLTVLSGIPLNQTFNYRITLTPQGVLQVQVNDRLLTRTLNSSWAAKPLYFKAGVYVQDNSGYETEAGAATFYDLRISHSAP
jgi:hypothetical protein